MADNIELDSGSGGATLAAASLSFSGDTSIVQIVGCGILSGSEGSWALSQFVGGAGAVAAGVQRVTLASDDPAVVDLAAMEVLLGTIDADTGAIKTAVELLDNAVDGNYVNVNMNAAGTDLAMNAGAMSAQTTRITIATDDTHFGAVGAASDIDGVVHGQLRYIADQLVTIDSDTNAIKTAVEKIDNVVAVLGTATYSEATTSGNVVGAVRNDDLATLANTDNEIAPLQLDNRGAMYVNQAAAEPKQASGVAAGGAPGTDDMIAAVGGKKLLILALSLFATSTTTNTIYVDNVDNDLLGNSGNGIALSLDADGDTVAGFVLPYNPGGWFKTDAVNEAVTLNSSAAQDIIWCITYIETD